MKPSGRPMRRKSPHSRRTSRTLGGLRPFAPLGAFQAGRGRFLEATIRFRTRLLASIKAAATVSERIVIRRLAGTNAVKGSRISGRPRSIFGEAGRPGRTARDLPLRKGGGCVADDRYHRDRKFLAVSRKSDEMSR